MPWLLLEEATRSEVVIGPSKLALDMMSEIMSLI